MRRGPPAGRPPRAAQHSSNDRGAHFGPGNPGGSPAAPEPSHKWSATTSPTSPTSFVPSPACPLQREGARRTVKSHTNLLAHAIAPQQKLLIVILQER